MKFRIAGIIKESVVDGPGIRLVVFAQGCLHACPNCHNPETHDPNGGDLVDTDKIMNLVARAKLIRGITLSGGEPFLQPGPLAHLANKIRTRGLDIVTYTGYTYEELMLLTKGDNAVQELLAATNILVDGLYRHAERDLSLAFRGSRNQRLIDVPRSLVNGGVVLWEDPAANIRLRA